MTIKSRTAFSCKKRFAHICIATILLVVSGQIPLAHSADPTGNIPAGTQGATSQPFQGTAWGVQPWQQTGNYPGYGNMGGMMGCGGMSSMMGMSGMQMGQGGTAMNMDQPMSMREILYILSMQDALQIVKDVISIQEKILAGNGQRDRSALLKELKGTQERLTKLLSDYRGMLTGRIKSD